MSQLLSTSKNTQYSEDYLSLQSLFNTFPLKVSLILTQVRVIENKLLFTLETGTHLKDLNSNLDSKRLIVYRKKKFPAAHKSKHNYV